MKLKIGKLYRSSRKILCLNMGNGAAKIIEKTSILFYFQCDNDILGIFFVFLDRDGDQILVEEEDHKFLKEVNGT